MSVDPYQVLGLAPGATRAQVTSAYRRAALVTHPDQGGDPARFAVVRAAYDWLMTIAPEHPTIMSTASASAVPATSAPACEPAADEWAGVWVDGPRRAAGPPHRAAAEEPKKRWWRGEV